MPGKGKVSVTRKSYIASEYAGYPNLFWGGPGNVPSLPDSRVRVTVMHLPVKLPLSYQVGDLE